MIVREQVIAAVRARLSTLGLPTTLNTSSAITAGGAIDIADTGQEIVETDSFVTRYSMGLDLSAAVTASDDDLASATRNDLYAQMVRVLFADPPLLGLSFVDDLTEGSLRYESAESADRPVLGFTLEIDVQFFNRNNDPGVAP